MSKIENFKTEITTLGRERTVWVYLPDGYDENGAPYPVIYMHDGQNLFFDHLTAYGAAWHVDKSLDEIFKHTGRACIVVGVECDGCRRLSEYSPWKINPLDFHSKKTVANEPCNRGGEGRAYGEWFVKVLKPLIEQKYNVDSSRSATAVAGSSMGGLISCYLGLQYQNVYETMGLFSTYTQFNQWAFDSFVRQTEQTQSQHAFIYCGGKEWGNDTPRNKRIENCSRELYTMLAKRGISCELVLNSDLPHYETSWEIYFYKFANDFLNCYYNFQQKQ